MKAGHTEEYVDGTSAAPWPQLDGVRPKTSPSLVDDRRSEDGEGRGGAKHDNINRLGKSHGYVRVFCLHYTSCKFFEQYRTVSRRCIC